MIDLRSVLATIITGEPVSVSSVRVLVPVLDGIKRPDLRDVAKEELADLTFQQRLTHEGSGEPVPRRETIKAKLITNSNGNQQLLVGNQLFDENN
jgi:hypothetical protein